MVEGRATTGPTLLVDGMSLAFRAYFALPTDLAIADGTVTNAVHGFAGMLVYLLREHRPAGMAVAFDLVAPTFRDEEVPDYKAGRAATPDGLLPQFDMIRSVLEALAVPVLGVEGFEADDVLATLATRAAERGEDVIVVTGDRDCFQLVEDPHVKVLYNRRGVSDYILFDEAGIAERTGVPPKLYPSLAALRGDPSDNLPGVPGIGEKTAARLLTTYGDLDGVFAHLDELTPKLRAALVEHEAQVRANARVIPLVRSVAVEVAEADVALGGWDGGVVRRRFEELELKSVWGRLVPLLRDGTLGVPAPGGELATDAEAPREDQAGAQEASGGTPASFPNVTVAVELTRPEGARATGRALAALAGRQGIALAARWEGDPGRSNLKGLAIAARRDDPPAGGPTHDAVWVEGLHLETTSVRRFLTRVLEPAGGLAAHDMKEVLRTLLPLGLDCRSLDVDTSVAAYLLDPSIGEYSLAAVATRYGLGQGAGAAEAGEGQLALEGHEPDTAAAAAQDAAVTDVLRGRLRSLVAREGMEALHDDVERPLVRVLARMEVAGIKVDRHELEVIGQELADEAAALEEQVHELAGHEFNVNSTPQLRRVLYEELGLTPQRRTKTGYSTDAATLERLRDQHAIVATLLRYREVEKLHSTYGSGLAAEVAADGRIHASFRQTVARTGRLSSERPNLHNIPVRTESGRRFRRAFVPEDGSVFLVADYDQIELRVLAHLAQDPGLLDAFATGSDVHRAVASGVYRVPAGEVTSAQRERAKMVSYGLAYGMEAYGLSQRLNAPVEEASEIIERYFEAFPKVRSYMEATVRAARHLGETRTVLGRRRPLPELHDRNFRVRQAAERQAMNAGIQGLAADIFKTALVRLDAALERLGGRSRLVLQVHDEVLVEVAEGERQAVEPLVRQALVEAASLSVPLEVSMAWGSSWAAAKGG